MSEETAIELSGLNKQYGRAAAVKSLDLQVSKGELFGFLGPNGAGKTTTIKMMTGLLEPSSGQACICGIDIWETPLKAKRRLAYVPDEPNLYPKLTAWEYLRFIGSVFQMSNETFRTRAHELLHNFNIEARAHELIESFSHGMKQKVALSGALLHAPDVLFLDEPTVGLDPGSARNLKNLLRRICDEGTTVFLSTHILEIAERMCDRVGIINEGGLIALGTMEELRNQEKGASLEDIFLEMTGDESSAEWAKQLDKEDN